MKKIINISGKDYTMQSSAYTQFAYKDLTGRSLLNDLQNLIKLKSKTKDNIELTDLDNITELILKISFVMIQEADSTQVQDYKSFLKSIDDLYTNTSWIEEVILLGCTPLSGRLQEVK